MKIVIETAPYSTLRNKQVDDYWYDADGTLQIRVAEELSDERRQHAVLLHALWKALTCRNAGVLVTTIDGWDAHFQSFGLPRDVEPGDDPQCPYYRQHQSATIIERMFIEEVHDNWQEYAKEIDTL